MKLGLIMFGTGDFALPTFLGLIDSTHDVLALVTQPERKASGRNRAQLNRMQQAASERSIPVLQPEDVNAADAGGELKSFGADAFVVADYGQILSASTLSIPRLAAINIHASLLPKYRGATPVAHAILKGEQETGVSIMAMEPRLDAGDVIATVSTPIQPHETTGELESRLAQLVVPLALQVLGQLATGTAGRLPQESSAVTRAPRLKKSHGAINWQQPADFIERHVRAMQPWPKAYTFLHSSDRQPLRLNILRIAPSDLDANGPPGRISAVTSGDLIVNTGDRPVRIESLQPEARRVMTAAEFLRGRAVSNRDWMSAEGANEPPPGA